MTIKYIAIALLLASLGLVGFIIFTTSNSQPTISFEPQPTASSTQTPQISTVTIKPEETVYVTLNTGEERKIADFVPFVENNFTEVRTYQSYTISPDKQFVAVGGSAFEEQIVQVYEVQTDTLHEVIYGQIDGWTSEGLLEIQSCDLSGENCVEKVSVGSTTPWIVEEVPGR